VDQVKSANADGIVLGISGGIDSAVLAHLLGEINFSKTIGI
jgi:NH3-dependent NAD+ synthetase